MCESVDANVKCVENKSFVVQQEDNCVPQVDMRSDIVIDLSNNSRGTPYHNVIAIQKFRLNFECNMNEVNDVPSNDCLKSEHEPFGDVVAHTVQDVNGQHQKNL
jgi:hypothetical protein